MSDAKRITSDYSDEDMIWALLLKNYGLSKKDVEDELGIPETTFRGWLDKRKVSYEDHRQAANSIYTLYKQLSTATPLLPDERRPKNEGLLLEQVWHGYFCQENKFTTNPNQMPRNKPADDPFGKTWVLLQLFCGIPEKKVCAEVGLQEQELKNWLKQDGKLRVYKKHAELAKKLFDAQSVQGQSFEEKEKLLEKIYDEYLCYSDTQELLNLHTDQTPLDPSVFNKSPKKHIGSPERLESHVEEDPLVSEFVYSAPSTAAISKARDEHPADE